MSSKVDILLEDPIVQNNAFDFWIQKFRLDCPIADSVDLAEYAGIRRNNPRELSSLHGRWRDVNRVRMIWESDGWDAGRRAEKGVGSRAEDQEKKEEEQNADEVAKPEITNKTFTLRRAASRPGRIAVRLSKPRLISASSSSTPHTDKHHTT